MKFDSNPNWTKWLFSLSLVLIFSVTGFSQIPEQINHKKFNYFLSSEYSAAKMRTRPRIYVAPVPDVAIPAVELAKPAPKAVSAIDLERQAFDLLNKRRVENGLKPIVWNEEVAKIARRHSQDMANNNYFGHQSLNGMMVDDRADSAGVKDWKSIGENIAYNRGYDDPVEFAVLRWMQSQSHRENLLSSKWKESGVGVALAADGKTYYFTQVFIVRK